MLKQNMKDTIDCQNNQKSGKSRNFFIIVTVEQKIFFWAYDVYYTELCVMYNVETLMQNWKLTATLKFTK